MFIIYVASRIGYMPCYVGYTGNTLELRVQDHRHDFQRFINGTIDHTCRALYEKMQEFGFDNFEFDELDMSNTKEEADKLEAKYIKELETLYPNGCNLTTGGQSGFKYCDATLIMKSESNRISAIENIDNYRSHVESMGLPPYIHFSAYNGERFLIKNHPLCDSKEFKVGTKYPTIDSARDACLMFLQNITHVNVKYIPPKKGNKPLPRGIISIDRGYRVVKCHKGERPMKDFTCIDKTDDENYKDALTYLNKLLEKWNLKLIDQ